MLLHDRIIVALDVSTENEALELVRALEGRVGYFKIGLELIHSTGVAFIKKLVDLGIKVFLDAKFLDIPNTVAGASRAVGRLGVSMFNVHAFGGLEMMKRAADSSREESAKLGLNQPKILGVTILTSINEILLNKQLGIGGSVEEHVLRLSQLSIEAGLDGVIASPQEAVGLRRTLPSHALIVTPGVRPAWATSQDQKRVLTPREAILNGATHLVIGRPITNPPKEIGTPLNAISRIIDEITPVLEKGTDT